MMEREDPWLPNRLRPFIASNAALAIPIELWVNVVRGGGGGGHVITIKYMIKTKGVPFLFLMICTMYLIQLLS